MAFLSQFSLKLCWIFGLKPLNLVGTHATGCRVPERLKIASAIAAAKYDRLQCWNEVRVENCLTGGDTLRISITYLHRRN